MTVLTKQQRIAELAKRSPKVCFTALNHYLDTEWLQEAYRRLRKDSAPALMGKQLRNTEKGWMPISSRSWIAPSQGTISLHR